MLKTHSLISFLFIFILTTDTVHAMGMLARVQQMKAQRQQGQAPQGQEPNGQGEAQQPTYQDAIDQRNQAIAQAILEAHNRALANDNTQAVATQDTATAQAQQQAVSDGILQQQTAPQENAPDVQDTVDLTDVWKKLDKKSTIWTAIVDDQAKILTVSEYIDRFHKEGVKINEPPLHYVQMIDEIVGQNPQMLQRPFGDLIQMVAIVDYDFDNGMNKDDLAKRILGEAGFEANKKRFSQ